MSKMYFWDQIFLMTLGIFQNPWHKMQLRDVLIVDWNSGSLQTLSMVCTLLPFCDKFKKWFCEKILHASVPHGQLWFIDFETVLFLKHSAEFLFISISRKISDRKDRAWPLMDYCKWCVPATFRNGLITCVGHWWTGHADVATEHQLQTAARRLHTFDKEMNYHHNKLPRQRSSRASNVHQRQKMSGWMVGRIDRYVERGRGGRRRSKRKYFFFLVIIPTPLLFMSAFRTTSLSTATRIIVEGTPRSTLCDRHYGDHDGENKLLHTIPHVQDLQDSNLCRSSRHQHKFFSTRAAVLSWIKTHKEQRHLLYGSVHYYKYFAFVLNEDYAFRHIFKSGGSTIEAQTGEIQVHQSKVGKRHLITTVRDPIDHFLSGWAECGHQQLSAMRRLINLDAPYDDRIQAWLQFLKEESQKKMNRMMSCGDHSHPQANFLFRSETEFDWDPKYAIIGDLDEMPGLLGMIGFPYNASITIGNMASENEIKNQYFPRDASLLSTRTIQDICRYVALDYYLFDFDPPSQCREELMRNIADMNKSISYWVRRSFLTRWRNINFFREQISIDAKEKKLSIFIKRCSTFESPYLVRIIQTQLTQCLV